jgi:hypothetical protein
MLPDLTTVLTDGSAKGETAKTTITESPSKWGILRTEKMKMDAFIQCQQKNQETSNIHHGSKWPPDADEGCSSTWNFFVPLISTEMEADHGDDVDDSTKGHLH